MRNRIFISILDEKSSKQFNLHKMAKKIMLYGILGFCAFLIGVFYLMNFLMEEVRDISEVKIQMIESYRSTYKQNQAIKDQINAKSLELIEVSQKVEDLEEIIDFSKNKDSLSYEPITKTLDLKERNFLLQIIPNGHPVENFQSILLLKNRLHPLKRRYGVDSGIDYLIKSGNPVRATADGIVELARQSASSRGYGRYIKIKHAYGFSSMYGHLSNVLVKKGDFVKKNQVIGYTGRSGESNGEKLYYEVKFLEGYQDARLFAQWGENNFESIFESGVNWNRLFWAIDDLNQLQTHR